MKRLLWFIFVFVFPIQAWSMVVCVGGLIAAGKTQFIARLTERCMERGISYHVIPELRSPAIGEMIAHDLKSVDALFLAHRCQAQLDAPIMSSLYDLVILERCAIDHLAFLDAFEVCGMIDPVYADRVKRVATELALPPPSAFIYLSISPEQAMERKRIRGFAHDDPFDLTFTFEHEKAYAQRIREAIPDPIVLDWSSFGSQIDLDALIDTLLARREVTI